LISGLVLFLGGLEGLEFAAELIVFLAEFRQLGGFLAEALEFLVVLLEPGQILQIGPEPLDLGVSGTKPLQLLLERRAVGVRLGPAGTDEERQKRRE